MTQVDPRIWTVTEAKARLSEILRLSEEEGPQCIGTRRRYVVVPEEVWTDRNGGPDSSASQKDSAPRKPLGQWLIENTPRGTNLEVPNRNEKDRPIPFIDY